MDDKKTVNTILFASLVAVMTFGIGESFGQIEPGLDDPLPNTIPVDEDHLYNNTTLKLPHDMVNEDYRHYLNQKACIGCNQRGCDIGNEKYLYNLVLAHKSHRHSAIDTVVDEDHLYNSTINPVIIFPVRTSLDYATRVALSHEFTDQSQSVAAPLPDLLEQNRQLKAAPGDDSTQAAILANDQMIEEISAEFNMLVPSIQVIEIPDELEDRMSFVAHRLFMIDSVIGTGIDASTGRLKIHVNIDTVKHDTVGQIVSMTGDLPIIIEHREHTARLQNACNQSTEPYSPLTGEVQKLMMNILHYFAPYYLSW